jgi:nitroreductase
MTRYVASPDVRLIQSRLFSPGYAGIGRWVLFDAASRRAFSAAGRDIVPDVVRIMARASRGATYDELLDEFPQVTADRLSGLCKAGLLIPGKAVVASVPPTFVSLYQRATFDYPFHDYSAPGWAREERALLDRYARLWPAPPSVLERPGLFHPLPRRALLDGPPDGRRHILSLGVLAWVLQHSFGPVGEIKTRHVTCIRRTSPSGGARHPAEVAVLLPRSIDGLPAGRYAYDVARHGLAYESDNIDPKISSPAFVIRLRVGRAMWRYRDLRALRPVLLDVGHIAETLALLLNQAGLATTLVSAPPPPSGNYAWLEEPPAAALIIGHSDARPWRRGGSLLATDTTEMLTNPAMVLRFGGGEIIGTTVWPDRREEALDVTDFLVLNHCVPSSRGDRLTTRAGIASAVPGSTANQISTLLANGLLLSRPDAEAFYSAAGLWVRHDWYLSLLAHLESLSWARSAPAISTMAASDGYVTGLEALANRRTTRAFSSEPLSAEKIGQVLSLALDTTDSVTAVDWIKVFIAPFAVTGLPARIHEWIDGQMKPLAADVTRDQVRDLTIGQVPAADAACAVWCVARLNSRNPAVYELGLIELGRLGQRICLAAADADVGVFLTPAIKDSATLNLLGVEPDPAIAAYVFGLGKSRSRM